jgi:hypothetical protein
VRFNKYNDTNMKLRKFQNLCGSVRRTLHGKDQKETLLKFCNVVVITTFALWI